MLRSGSCSADVARYLVGTAGLTGAGGHTVSAARLLGAAYAILRTSPDPIHLASQMVWDRIEATVKSQVDENVFSALWAEGEVLTRAQAVAYAVVAIRASRPRMDKNNVNDLSLTLYISNLIADGNKPIGTSLVRLVKIAVKHNPIDNKENHDAPTCRDYSGSGGLPASLHPPDLA
jgi:hypothetical protein